MRSRLSAELVLTWLAAATMEGAWLTLANILLQWLKQSTVLSLGIVPFTLAVAAGMIVARSARHLPQARYATVITVAVVIAALIAALLSGVTTSSVGAFVRAAVLDPGVWLLGIAVLRGAAHGEPGTGYSTERVFSLGIPGLIVFWLLATSSGMTANEMFATAAFATTLSFVSAGLLSLGLSRLSDLDVDAIDRGARRRWLLLVTAVVGVVLVIGIPLAAVLGLPATAAIGGVLGPLAQVLIWIFYLLAIPIFFVLDLIAGLFQGNANRPVPSFLRPTPLPTNLPPLIERPTGPPPDLTLVLFALVAVGVLVLLRLVALLMTRPVVRDGAVNADEIRAAEPIVLPHLPNIRRPRLPGGRQTPHTAAAAYRMSLVALAGGPDGRMATETPRSHAQRVNISLVGRDIGRLASDYQLSEFAAVHISASETRRALERWRRVVRQARRRR
jgi:hypothetical protein